MGPLALSDLIGLDTVLSVSETLYAEHREQLFAPPPLLQRLRPPAYWGERRGGALQLRLEPRRRASMLQRVSAVLAGVTAVLASAAAISGYARSSSSTRTPLASGWRPALEDEDVRSVVGARVVDRVAAERDPEVLAVRPWSARRWEHSPALRLSNGSSPGR